MVKLRHKPISKSEIDHSSLDAFNGRWDRNSAYDDRNSRVLILLLTFGMLKGVSSPAEGERVKRTGLGLQNIEKAQKPRLY